MKKVLVGLILCFMAFGLIGCGSSDEPGTGGGGDVVNPTPSISINDAYNQLTIAGDLNNIYGNLTLVSKIGDVVVTWSSSNSSVLNNNGVINPKDVDVTVTLTATLTKGGDTREKNFICTVKGVAETYDSISDALGKTGKVNVKATVSKVRGNDFFIQDSTGGLFVYCNQQSNSVQVGDVVVVEGTMGEYGGAKQITAPKVNVLSNGSSVTTNTVSDISSTTLNENMYNLISVNGLTIDTLPAYDTSRDYNATVSDSHGNQVTVHINKRLGESARQEIAGVLSNLTEGATVDLNNIVVSVYNSKLQLLLCTANDIAEANLDTDTKIERITASLLTVKNKYEGASITGNLTLPTTSLYNSTVVWTSSNEAVVSTSGVITRPEVGQPDVVVTLSYVATVDGVSTSKVTFNVTIKARPEVGEMLDYYMDAAGLTGQALSSALTTIINTGVKQLSYSNIWETCEEGNEDPNNSNNVILFYSGVSVPKNDHVSGSTGWNREHTWPKSKGLTGQNIFESDAHHLMPTDNRINSVRGSNPFAMGGSYVTSGYGWTSTSKSTGSTFEPRDEVKGDCARIIMYVAIRHRLDVRTIMTVDLMLEWHEQDPVDEFEMNRNEVLFGYQNNRNPFIDNPQFAGMIWS